MARVDEWLPAGATRSTGSGLQVCFALPCSRASCRAGQSIFAGPYWQI